MVGKVVSYSNTILTWEPSSTENKDWDAGAALAKPALNLNWTDDGLLFKEFQGEFNSKAVSILLSAAIWYW